MRNLSLGCRLWSLICISPVVIFGAPAEAPTPNVATAINSLGLDLYREQVKTAGSQSVLLSPYSIATVLAMTYLGAAGATKAEMIRVLRFPDDAAACAREFRRLHDQIQELAAASARDAADVRRDGGEATPLTVAAANRVVVQEGFVLQPAFLQLISAEFSTAPGVTDFRGNPEGSRSYINRWVAEMTRNRVPDLLPVGQPDSATRLALVNALYLKASWLNHFDPDATQPRPFHLRSRASVTVPTMDRRDDLRYGRRDGYSVVTLPYDTGRLQFVLLVPDAVDGLAALERNLTARDLAECVHLAKRDVILTLPRFKLAPATMPLGRALKALGLRTAFDLPPGSADFSGMVTRTPNGSLAIGEVFHKTWLSLDENGTEAAAATAITLVTLGVSTNREPVPPVEVRADRPFLFAVQHVDSGVCLFLGRVTDPR